MDEGGSRQELGVPNGGLRNWQLSAEVPLGPILLSPSDI